MFIFCNRSGLNIPNRPSSLRPRKILEAAKNISCDDYDIWFGHVFFHNLNKKSIIYYEWPSAPLIFRFKGFGLCIFFFDILLMLFLRACQFEVIVFYRDAYWVYPEFRAYRNRAWFLYLIHFTEFKILSILVSKFAVPSGQFADLLSVKDYVVFPPACDELLISKIEEARSVTQAKPKDCGFSIIYVGGVNKNFYDLKDILKLRESCEITICCRREELGAMDIELQEAISSGEVNCIHESVSLNSTFLADYDLGFLYHPKSQFKSVAVPFKFYEYMAAGLPVIIDPNTPISRMVKVQRLGIVGGIDEISERMQCYQGELMNWRANCLAFAKSNTWENRLVDLLRRE
jgi:hypothetical protein